MNVRGALDSFALSGIDLPEFLRKNGEVVVIAGGVPELDPEICRDKNVFVCGDCWKIFPSKPLVEEAVRLAKSVTLLSRMRAGVHLLQAEYRPSGNGAQVKNLRYLWDSGAF